MAPSATKVYVPPSTERSATTVEQKPEKKESTPFGGNVPEKKFKAGSIHVTVWNNKTQKQNGEEGEYQTISIERSYLDKDGKWQTSNSFRTNDIPKAIVVLQNAYEYIVLQEQDLTKRGY